MESIYGTALSGLHGADSALEVTANNIANINTGGFEAVEPLLGALPTTDPPGPFQAGARVGMGTRLDATMRLTVDPTLVPTGRALDVVTRGGTFLTLRRPNGTLAYARSASFDVAPDGTLVTAGGLTLSPAVRVPATVHQVTIDGTGAILGLGADGRTRGLGRMRVVDFVAPENLSEDGAGLYTPTLGSGQPRTARVGTGGTVVLGGYTLGSTVDLATQLSSMVGEQRMYEANAKALQTLDGLVNTVVSMQQR